MRICLMIEGQEGVTWDQWVALARIAEDEGFDALFRSDHYVSFDRPERWGSLDAWTTLAALAPITGRIRLGTMVSPVTFRHPSVVAKAVTTVDHASGGRVELGMGAGWFEAEHRAYGFPFPPTTRRYDLLEESVEIVHRLWDRREPSVTFEGRHYELHQCHALPRPLQDPHPPLILGGSGGPRSVRLAARWADEYNLVSGSPEEARRICGRIDEACEAIGRDPSTLRRSLMANTLVGADERDLSARVARLLARDGSSEDPEAVLAGAGPDDLWGTSERIVERLARYADAGIERILLQYLHHEDLEGVEILGSEVVPAAASI